LTATLVCPAGAVALTGGGNGTTGGWLSVTVTRNLQLAALPATSTTEQVTSVVPTGNIEPDWWEQETWSGPGQLSQDSGAKVVVAPHWPVMAGIVRLTGHRTPGDCRSRTVTVNVQDAVAEAASEAVQVTGCVPTGNDVPEAGWQTTLTGATPPVVVGLKTGVALQRSSGAVMETLAGHTIDSGTGSAASGGTVTVNAHQAALNPSVAVQVTAVVPGLKTEPAGGAHSTWPTLQSSDNTGKGY
jgi:hypothetical protein